MALKSPTRRAYARKAAGFFKRCYAVLSPWKSSLRTNLLILPLQKVSLQRHSKKNGGTTERLFLFLISIHLQHLLWRPDIYIRSFIVPGIPCDKSLHFIRQRSRILYGTLKVFPFCSRAFLISCLLSVYVQCNISVIAEADTYS